jgi:type I restriction enzyme S subunit
VAKPKTKPDIRYKEFTEDWEQRKLGDLGSVVMNRRIFKEQTVEAGEVPFYKIGTFGGEPDAFISRELFEEYKSKYPYPKVGDILISASGSIGKTIEYTGKDEYFQDSNIVWLKCDGRLDNSFLKYFYSIVKWQGLEGSTIKRLYNKNILDTKINVPSSDEQKAVGLFFSDLDNLITLQQRGHDKTVNIKKAMLQKMFPKEGSDRPEIRFAGFTGAWEQRKLGDMGATITGLSGKTKDDFGHGNAEFVTYMNVFTNPIAAADGTERVEIDNSQSEVRYGDVFFTTSSETPEEVGMSSIWLTNRANVYLNSFCFGWRPTVDIDPHYLAFMLRSSVVRKKFIFLAQGISRYNISKNKAMEMSVPFPSLDEQKQVGRLFFNLDRLITLHHRELVKLQNIKKALLGKMFV